MVDTPRHDDETRTPASRKPWSAPQLLEYGHIGKLTQGASGTKSDGGTTKRNTCL